MSTSLAATRSEQSSLVQNAPARMLELAIEKGAGLDQMQQLMDLQERWEKNEARKAFVVAMNALKVNPPAVMKDKKVAFKDTTYMHATLASVCDAAVQAMSRHGLSHRWEVNQQQGITVRCVVTHELGHSETTTMTAPPDGSGSKNAIQQIASTVTYLQRYTLMAALGMAAKDMDDDGHGASAAPLTDDQVEIHDKAMTRLTQAAEKGDFAAAWKDTTPAVRKLIGPRQLSELKRISSEVK